MNGLIFPGDDPDRLLATLVGLTRDIERLRGGIAPTPDDLEAAPVLHGWAPGVTGVACLVGAVRAHPLLGDRRMISTSEVYAIDEMRGWARTFSRYYMLGARNPKSRTSAMRNEWRSALVARYPQFFSPGGFPSVEEGWSDLVERALRRIASAMGSEPEGAVFGIIQTKEKFGTVRIYYRADRMSSSTREAILEAIDLAEARSACTCEICGDEGRLYDDAGWLATRCRRHAVGDAVPVRQGWSNLRMVRTIHRGGLRINSCRRYDRKGDRFVDAPLPDGWDEV